MYLISLRKSLCRPVFTKLLPLRILLLISFVLLITTSDYAFASTSAPCIVDSDCTPSHYCKINTSVVSKGTCQHTALRPLTLDDVISGFLALLGSSLSVVAGVGGGGLYVPILMLILGFEADEAVPLSKAMILGGALINAYFLWNLRVYDKANDRPVAAVDMNALLLLTPMCLSGTVLGALLNVLLPNILIIVLLCVVLGYSAYKIFLKYLKERRKDGLIAVPYEEEKAEEVTALTSTEAMGLSEEEEGYREPCVEAGATRASTSASVQDLDVNGCKVHHSVGQDKKMTNAQDSKYFSILKDEETISKKKGALLVLMWVVILSTGLVKKLQNGGCGLLFWSMTFAPFFVGVFLTLCAGGLVKREYRIKQECEHKFTSADFEWNNRNVRIYPFFSLLAGLAAGMVGIGGGMVAGPLLLLMAQDPDPVVLTSITGALVVFTASSTTTVFILLDALQLDYALFLAAFCLIGGFLGRIVFSPVIQKYNKKSWILLVLFSTTVLSCILTAAQGLYKAIFFDPKWGGFNVEALCGAI
eukprot:Nk52_evm39s252 gene=Nk52_evmTU39s252